MGYFSNGTEGLDYNHKYCHKCQNWRQKEGEQAAGCPVWDAHLCYLGSPGASVVLDSLIPFKDGFSTQCKMFLPHPNMVVNVVEQT